MILRSVRTMASLPTQGSEVHGRTARGTGWIRLGALVAALFLVDSLAADGVIISEFMARNLSVLADEDGAFSDWIELYNDSDAAVNLGGWALSDNADQPQRWVFPAVVLPPRAFLIVFASGKDRRDAAGELHTDFRLAGDGEDLLLVAPDLSVTVPSFESYPPQIDDSSFGVVMNLAAKPVVAAGAIARYLVPQDGSLELTWTEHDFDDSGWAQGPTGIGFDLKDVPTYADLIRTDVAGVMAGENASIYLRLPFLLAPDEVSKYVRFSARFEDGLAVFINGQELATVNLRALRYNRGASPERSAAQARTGETIPLALPETLRAGENTLALQLANRNRRDEDVLCIPELEVFDIESVDTAALRFFASPSPASPNADARRGVAPEPAFSHPGGTVSSGLLVELTSEAPDAEIRYTTDGSLPTPTSTVYAAPIEVPATMVVRARTFRAGFLPSRAVSRSFLVLAEDFEFDSNLPVFVVSANGGVGGSFTPMHMTVFDRDADGRAWSGAEPDFMGIGVIKTRGSSTGGRQKASLSFEIQDEYGDDHDVEILGFPPESDFILYGAYNFDRAHVRNAFVYEISNNIGRYAVRTQFCELYLARNGRAVSSQDYWGVYTFMEKVKRGEHRVDVERLGPEHDSEPEITGGYIVKIDRLDPGDRGFSVVGGAGQMGWVYPKEADVTPEQSAWLRNFFTEFNASLSSRDADDPDIGYRAYIDELSWIDHHLINEFTKNPDALRLSTYLFMKRDGLLENGPVWDFDRTLGPDEDSRAQSPLGWMGPHSSAWWGRLLARPGFLRRYKARWQQLRQSEMALEKLHGIIDRMAAEIGEAAGRDAMKWRRVPNQRGWEVEIAQLKTWVEQRLAWMDTQLVVPPELSHPGGRVERGLVVTMEVPVGQIYYTLNGPVPVRGGEPAPEAIAYSGEGILITQNTRIRAAARISDRLWSPPDPNRPVEAYYVTDAPTLAITELMYNPPAGDPEFIEILNFGDRPVDLTGLRIEGRVDFTFEEEQRLDAGGYVVLTDDIGLFSSRYGGGIRLAGEFSGRLSNSRMEIELLGADDEPFLAFTYEDDWHPSTDGDGHSLVLRDAASDPETWNSGDSWRASLAIGGSPGAADREAPQGWVIAGDLDQNGVLNISDSVRLLGHLFGGRVFVPCGTDEANERLLDMNGDAAVNLADAVHALDYLFRRGAPPALGADCVVIPGCPDLCAAVD